MPVLKVKNKTKYDVLKLVDILSKYTGKEVKSVVENIHTLSGQGLSSSGALMEGKGILIGVLTALFRESPILTAPQSWKKSFPELTDCPEVLEFREQINKLKEKLTGIKKSEAKKITKEINRINSQLKSTVKTRTRLLASELYPHLEGEFKRIKDDGKADALFIALHTIKKIEELSS